MAPRTTRRACLRALACVVTLALAGCGGTATLSSAASSATTQAPAATSSTAPPTTAVATTTASSTGAAAPTATSAAATTNSAATTAAPAASSAAAPGQAAVQLQVWQNWGTEEADPRTAFTVKTLQPRFADEHPGLRFSLSFAGNGTAVLEKITANVAAGTPPDVSFVYAQWTVGLGRKGVTIPLDDLMARAKDFDQADFYPDIWEALRYQNKVWGFPQNRHPIVVFYRTDLFSRYSLAAPETWTDFTELVQRLTHADQGQYASDEGTGDSNLWDSVQRGNGGAYLSADGSKVAWDSDAGLQALQYYADLYQKYKLAPPKAIPSGFEGGKVAMTISGPWRVNGYLTKKLPVLAFPFPRGSRQAATHANIDTWGILKTTPERQAAAFTFVSWYASKPIYGDWAIRFQHAPLTRSIAADPAYQQFVAATPIMAAFLAPAEVATITPLTPITDQLTAILGKQVTAAVTGTTDPLTALKQATSEADAALEQAAKA